MPSFDEVSEIISKLPEEERAVVEEFLADSKKAMERAAKAAILARNFSHGVGKHVGSD
jgi:hypothetical protein